MDLIFADARTPRPALPRAGDAGVHTWRDESGALIAYGCHHDGWHWMSWPSFATFRFSAYDPRITAYPDPSVPEAVITGVFTRSVLPMALQALGHEALHASAVVHPVKGVILFAARSRVGKSTIAFGLASRAALGAPKPQSGEGGLRQWADDGVVWKMEGLGDRPVPTAIPLPFKPRLRAASTGMLGAHLRDLLLDVAAAKQRRADAETRAEEAPLGPTRIGALCLLDRTDDALPGDQAASLTRLREADAFTAVLANAHEFDPFNQARRAVMLKAYLDLVGQVPVFTLRFRAGAPYLDRVLDTIVRGLELQPTGAGLCVPL